jgi:hypothetical protein
VAGAQVFTVSDKVRFIESVFGTGNMARNGKNFAIWCPMCAPRDKGKRKLVIRLEDDANHCWTCTWRARSLAPLLKKFAGMRDLIRYRDTFMNENVRSLWMDPEDIETKKVIKLPDDFTLIPIADQRDPDTRSLIRYLTSSRNVTERDMWYYKLGRSNDPTWSRRVMIPSFNADGELNYLIGRAVDRQKRRYENEEVERTSIVFNEININWSKRLVICEGAFDMMKCGENATCLLGASLNENHLLFDRIVSNSTPIALALDSSAMKNALYIARKLEEYDIDVVLVDLGSHKDPGEMTKSAFREALADARPYSWQFDIKNRMKRASKVTLSSW